MVLTCVLLGAAVYVLVVHWSTVHTSLQVARSASIPWLVVSLLLMAYTFCIAAAIYGVLALHPLRYRQTLLVEVSTAFVNRLLPSGIGGLGLHGVYLYHRKHKGAEATVVVSVNNLIGMLAHLLLLATLLVWQPGTLRQLFTRLHLGLSWPLTLAVIVVLGMVFAVRPIRTRLARFGRNMLVSVHEMQPWAVVQALLLAVQLTIVYTLILHSVAHSIGVDLNVFQIFIVFSIGMLASTATPTPGGLVGAEAGLFAGFVAYGVAAPQAGAVVLLYRLITYWLPLLPGVIALVTARKHRLV